MLIFLEEYLSEHKVHEVVFGRSFCANSNAEFQRRSGIQSKLLDGGTSNKVPKAGRAYNSSRND